MVLYMYMTECKARSPVLSRAARWPAAHSRGGRIPAPRPVRCPKTAGCSSSPPSPVRERKEKYSARQN